MTRRVGPGPHVVPALMCGLDLRVNTVDRLPLDEPSYTLEAVARAVGDIGALGPAETQLRMGLGNLFALAEAYPDLKANDNFQHLQSRISGLENAIADRREFYNESVNTNNIRIEQFPDVIIAKNLGFGAKQLLEFSEEEKKDVDMKELFS